MRQGTPAFIAEALARSPNPVEYFPFEGLKTLNENLSPHPQTDRAHSDENFFEGLEGYPCLNEENISHQAIHDAEFLFWIIVFFHDLCPSKRLRPLRNHTSLFRCIRCHDGARDW